MGVGDLIPYNGFPEFQEWSTPVDDGAWTARAELLAAACERVSGETLRDAIKVAVRLAAIETGAIEDLYSVPRGVTWAIATQAAAWTSDLDEIGDDVAGYFEAQLSAYELVLDAVTHATPISEAWLREVHARITAGQATYRVKTEVGWQARPLPRGEYKSHANNVSLADGTIRSYAPASDTPAEMHRLVEGLRSPHFEEAHPALQASWAHYALTAVHPFADGNGRTARALASVYLYRATSIPLVIFADRKDRYLDALEAADRGDHRSFVKYIMQRAVDTMTLVTGRLDDAADPLVEGGEEIRRLLVSHGNLSHGEVQAIGQRVWNTIQEAVNAAFSEARLPPDAQRGLSQEVYGPVHFDGPYKVLQGGTGSIFTLGVPPFGHVEMTLIPGFSPEPDVEFAFCVIDANRPGTRLLEIRFEDVYPDLSQSGEGSINLWARAKVREMLRELKNAVEGGVRGSGF